MNALKQRTWLAIAGIAAIIVGTWLMYQSWVWGQPQQQAHPLRAYFALNVGGLLIFVAGYTFISEVFLRKNFIADLEATLHTARLAESVERNGLTEIIDVYSDEQAFQSMRKSSSVSMLVIRSNSFFRDYNAELKKLIADGKLHLDVVLPNPNNHELMNIMATKQSDVESGQQLAESIARALNTWLVDKIYLTVPESQRGRLRVYLVDGYPLYSAYLFDERTLWYIPYHYRKDRQRIPVFVYAGSNLGNQEVYKDYKQLIDGKAPLDISHHLEVRN